TSASVICWRLPMMTFSMLATIFRVVAATSAEGRLASTGSDMGHSRDGVPCWRCGLARFHYQPAAPARDSSSSWFRSMRTRGGHPLDAVLLGVCALAGQGTGRALWLLLPAVFAGHGADHIRKLRALRLGNEMFQTGAGLFVLLLALDQPQARDATQRRRIDRDGVSAQRALHDP